MVTRTLWRAEDFLEDGRLFTVEWYERVWTASMTEPPDVEVSDDIYRIDGTVVEFEDLPDEVTLELIDVLREGAKPVL